jgi:hypothetical protein
MNTLTHIQLRDEIDETLAVIVDPLAKGHPYDAYASHEQEQMVKAELYDRWSRSVTNSLDDIRFAGQQFGTPFTPDTIMSSFNENLSGNAVTNSVKYFLAPQIMQAFNNGRAASSALFTKQTGNEPMKKDLVGFGAIFGLTEDHALQALLDQLVISASGFWDQQLSDSIKAELVSYFAATETRDELIAKIEAMVNARLVIGGSSSLPTSYFDNLATHQIVRARNVGSYYRAKSLQAKSYTLMNPHDKRTCPICNAVTQGQVYTMQGAESTISGILTANTIADLKAVAPFYKKGDDVVNPVPPLHWAKCRCWMYFQF